MEAVWRERRHPKRRLTDMQVRAIRREREEAMRQLSAMEIILPPGHPATMPALAKRYGVSSSIISDVITRRTYKDV